MTAMPSHLPPVSQDDVDAYATYAGFPDEHPILDALAGKLAAITESACTTADPGLSANTADQPPATSQENVDAAPPEEHVGGFGHWDESGQWRSGPKPPPIQYEP